jgi:hypothetical protein
MRMRHAALALGVLVFSVVAACAGEDGSRGPEGPAGSPGPQGTPGAAGSSIVWKDATGAVQTILLANNNTFWMDDAGIIWHLSHTEGTFVEDAVAFYYASADCSGPASVPVFMLARQGMKAPDGTYRAMIDAPTFSTGLDYESFAVAAAPCQSVSGTLGTTIQSSSMNVVVAPTPLAIPLHPERVP